MSQLGLRQPSGIKVLDFFLFVFVLVLSIGFISLSPVFIGISLMTCYLEGLASGRLVRSGFGDLFGDEFDGLCEG